MDEYDGNQTDNTNNNSRPSSQKLSRKHTTKGASTDKEKDAIVFEDSDEEQQSEL